MATTSKRKTIREATSSVQGRQQGQRTRVASPRQTAPAATAPPSRLGPRSQQGGPKLNELRGKIAKLEQERLRMRRECNEQISEIETLLLQLSATPASVWETGEAIRECCSAIRGVLA